MNEHKGEPPAERVDYIDNLRIFLIILVVFHHQAIGFGAPGGWYYVLPAPPQSLSIMVLSLFVIINQAFFMSLFFFVSAYFTPRSLDKQGTYRFLMDRLKRLGIPLLVYFLLLNPILAYMSLRFRGETEATYLRFMLSEGPKYFGCGRLWFVFALLIFTCVYAGIVYLNKNSQRKPVPANFPSKRQIALFIGHRVTHVPREGILAYWCPIYKPSTGFFPSLRRVLYLRHSSVPRQLAQPD